MDLIKKDSDSLIPEDKNLEVFRNSSWLRYVIIKDNQLHWENPLEFLPEWFLNQEKPVELLIDAMLFFSYKLFPVEQFSKGPRAIVNLTEEYMVILLPLLKLDNNILWEDCSKAYPKSNDEEVNMDLILDYLETQNLDVNIKRVYSDQNDFLCSKIIVCPKQCSN